MGVGSSLCQPASAPSYRQFEAHLRKKAYLACSNQRSDKLAPLCYTSDTENNYLSPAHFLISWPFTTVPDPDLSHFPVGRLGYWQSIQAKLQGFWKKLHQEYLTTTKWTTSTPNLSIGELVLVKDHHHQHLGTSHELWKPIQGRTTSFEQSNWRYQLEKWSDQSRRLLFCPIQKLCFRAGRDVRNRLQSLINSHV